MKRLLLICLLLEVTFACAQVGGRVQPDIALPDPDPEFPVRVHLFNVGWNGAGLANHGFGTGNIISAGKEQGFDYAFECSFPFMPNAAPGDTYQARWKKSTYRLEILTMDGDALLRGLGEGSC